MSETWRLFIAIELPEAILAQLTTVQERLKRQVPRGTVRWVRVAGIHLTLKFLGDVPLSQRDDIEHELAQAATGHTPFTLAARHLGCFPNPKRPRVVWVGVQGAVPALANLRDAVEEHIAPLGYPTEDRPFKPHLTLGRVQRDARRDEVARLGELIADTKLGELGRWDVSSVSLMRSELKPDGAVYSRLFSAPLDQ
ncbi:MAG: RNA 2',3'-cyclic phosphodiesterase [Chloroflexi bacterium]|nr:RNA 2',3'-cyclic phosphodiesterase [Chloroflexota bacterium]